MRSRKEGHTPDFPLLDTRGWGYYHTQGIHWTGRLVYGHENDDDDGLESVHTGPSGPTVDMR